MGSNRTTIRVVTANGQGWGPPMVQSDHRKWALALRSMHATFICVQEQWIRRFIVGLVRNLSEHYGLWMERMPLIGHRGVGVLWARDESKIQDRGNVRLSGIVAGAVGVRSMRWIWNDIGVLEVVVASAHLSPKGPRWARRLTAIMRRRALRRIRPFIREKLQQGASHVIIGIDANMGRQELFDALGTHILGRPVRVRTSPDKGIDHIIIVGPAQVLLDGLGPRTPSDHRIFYVDLSLRHV